MFSILPYVFGVLLTVGFVACGIAGCAPARSPLPANAYVRAQPVADPPPPTPRVVRVPASPGLPGQMKRLPRRTIGEEPVAVAPQQVVADANRLASQAPTRADTFNAIVEYPFEPGDLYQVYASPMHVTDLTLAPGEKVLGQPASGDVVRWVLALGKSEAAGVEQWHVYVKPTRPDLETNLTINTDRRTYRLELHSYAETYMAAVEWEYPHEEMARLQAEATESAAEQRSSAPIVSLDALNFRYTIEVAKGTPAWTPVQVFDDGRKTFIRFPETMLVREAPALFVLRNKETQLVNYRVRGDFYVVDRLIDSAELRVGQEDQEIVRVARVPAGHR